MNNDENLKITFVKLGFDREKSNLEKLDFDKIKNKLSYIELEEPGSIKLPQLSLNEIKQKTKNYTDTFLKPNDLMVDTFDDETVNKLSGNALYVWKKINELNKTNITNDQFANSILKLYKNGSKRKNVFAVPVKETIGHSMIGSANKGPIFVINYNDFLKKVPIYAESIVIGNNKSLLSVGTYMHEITHLLVDRHKGVVKNYFNDEFLTIFMEKAIVDYYDKTNNKKFIKASEIQRLSYVKYLIDNLEKEETKFDCYKYTQSTFYAGLLFDKFSNSNDDGKEKIMQEIKSIMVGKSTVDDLIKAEDLKLDEKAIFNYIDKVAQYQKEYENEKKNMGEL